MKFGILGAMPHEVALMARIDDRASQRRSWQCAPFSKALGPDRKSCWCFRAWERFPPSITTLLLLERFGVTHIVFTGVAGAIDPDLRIGDVVIAERLVQHDMDASPLPAFQAI